MIPDKYTDRPITFMTLVTLSSIIIAALLCVSYRIIMFFQPHSISQGLFLLSSGIQLIIQLIAPVFVVFENDSNRPSILLIAIGFILLIIGVALSFYTTFGIWFLLSLPNVDLI